jgi:hypothetical protein
VALGYGDSVVACWNFVASSFLKGFCWCHLDFVDSELDFPCTGANATMRTVLASYKTLPSEWEWLEWWVLCTDFVCRKLHRAQWMVAKRRNCMPQIAVRWHRRLQSQDLSWVPSTKTSCPSLIFLPTSRSFESLHEVWWTGHLHARCHAGFRSR